jgi:hypothetical protein
MAAPPNNTFLEGQIFTLHNAELYNKEHRASSAYSLLDQYNFEGTGTMPSVTWVDPLGNNWNFTPGSGEIGFAGTPYTGLNPSQKRVFFQYLPKFIQVCLDAYDDNYNL